jgi:hypothetical protein
MSPQKGIPAKSVPNEPGMSQPGPEAARPGPSSVKDYLRSAASCAAVEYAPSNASFARLRKSFAWLRNYPAGPIPDKTGETGTCRSPGVSYRHLYSRHGSLSHTRSIWLSVMHRL